MIMVINKRTLSSRERQCNICGDIYSDRKGDMSHRFICDKCK